MKPVISIGTQDFEFIRNNHYFYIDKTSFIKEWWENGDAVTLITGSIPAWVLGKAYSIYPDPV